MYEFDEAYQYDNHLLGYCSCGGRPELLVEHADICSACLVACSKCGKKSQAYDYGDRKRARCDWNHMNGHTK
jgi:hypothetical protein